MLNEIITGDARELAKQIPDNSVDLIFCDPVWWETEQYRWLAKTATRLLKSGKSVIAQVGTGCEFRLEAENAMTGNGLEHRPLIIEIQKTPDLIRPDRAIASYKPYIWMMKPGKSNDRYMKILVKGKGRSKQNHAWEDSTAVFEEAIIRLTEIGDIVLDPFCGGGTVPAVCKQLGRNYIAFEIDPDTAECARERVRNTQMPLFIMQPEQLELRV